MSILLTIFLLVLAGQVVTWIGKTVLLDFAYAGYLRLTRSPLATKQRALKATILANKAELMKTSAQDQFAKWAKLRRSVDKGLADLEKLNAEISSAKSGFAFKFNAVLWLLTTGLQFVYGWWHRRSAVFFLPPGWLGPLGWWVGLPFAPAGAVSVGVWQMACRRVVNVGERVVKEFLVPAPQVVGETAEAPSASPTPFNTPHKSAAAEKKAS